MNLTLHSGEKLVLVLATSNITLASITEDMQNGRIKHDPTSKTGRQIIAVVENDGPGTITLASVIKGDLDASGAKDVNDTLAAGSITVASAPGMAVLDENALFSTAILA